MDSSSFVLFCCVVLCCSILTHKHESYRIPNRNDPLVSISFLMRVVGKFLWMLPSLIFVVALTLVCPFLYCHLLEVEWVQKVLSALHQGFQTISEGSHVASAKISCAPRKFIFFPLSLWMVVLRSNGCLWLSLLSWRIECLMYLSPLKRRSVSSAST